ncbi:uncharacterized protein LOC122024966 [Zingiber officinale]|uniref:Uncharacterized protein n=1 Tax=Zingiber officinale TaxID=94328 RepID=A0A8J5KDC9_ZINOF|nr:uncharacterized protein LOC122024966 [Zingiber officinale]KAG6476493.1 hypothetical protein ZIOFF_065735 [Zingiber officinale]
METAVPNVQRVNKASSDELLRKFAELDADPPARPYSLPRPSSTTARIFTPMAVRKKSCRAINALSSRELISSSSSYADGRPARRGRTSAGQAEWKSLLPLSNRRSSSKSLLRRIGVRRSDDAAPGIGLFFAIALQKTWRKTMASASKMIVEKHCPKHVRLISDNV